LVYTEEVGAMEGEAAEAADVAAAAARESTSRCVKKEKKK
jgi:hypothetical protein